MTLLPAARRGRDYVRDNGSPWRWAWYPWTLFGLLAFAVPARSALLCWSMHHVANAATEPYIFGPYFLAPFLLCVGVLLLEIGLVERHKGVLLAAMSVPPILLALAVVGHRAEDFYQGFLGQFTARLGGTPLYLTLARLGGVLRLRGAPAGPGGDRGAVGGAGDARVRLAPHPRPRRSRLASTVADPGGRRPAVGGRAAEAVMPGGAWSVRAAWGRPR